MENGLSGMRQAMWKQEVDKMALGWSSWDGLTQRLPDRKQAAQTREVSHCILSGSLGSDWQLGTSPGFSTESLTPQVPQDGWSLGVVCSWQLPLPWEMNGLTASHPAPTMALAWRHLCRAPLMVAPEAALHTPVSPDHPACPKCPPGWKGIPGSPPPATGSGRA